ncbi:MAG: GNAT family N-acetyltransferase [Thermoguttaceae bacterium]
MDIRVVTADALTPDQLAAWDAIQRADATLASPYFRPEFTQAVAAVRKGVEVGVLEDGGRPVGFFPFQRGAGRTACPVGGKMSDFQGVIARPEVAWQPKELLRGCRLVAWHFDHLLSSQTQLQPHRWRVETSPYLDLSRGWDGYRADQLAAHPRSFKQAMRKLRRAETEAGPVRVELNTDRRDVFESLVRWKIAQYERTGVTNVLAFDWTVALLDRIRRTDGERFSGVLSALYLGDILAAVLLSMRSGGVLHAWFSAYRPEFAALSPGLMLWMELARRCPELGIQRLDLGKGDEAYKRHLASGAVEVAEGAVDLRPIRRLVRRGCHRACDWARQSSLRRPLLVPGRMIRRALEARGFRS